jgi:hypothetical protein
MSMTDKTSKEKLADEREKHRMEMERQEQKRKQPPGKVLKYAKAIVRRIDKM